MYTSSTPVHSDTQTRATGQERSHGRSVCRSVTMRAGSSNSAAGRSARQRTRSRPTASIVQRLRLQRRQRRQAARAHAGQQPLLQGRAFQPTQVGAVAAVQRFEQQVGLDLFDGSAASPCGRLAQCSQTRISDSSCATSTGLVM